VVRKLVVSKYDGFVVVVVCVIYCIGPHMERQLLLGWWLAKISI
jgi:hypothetical protein